MAISFSKPTGAASRFIGRDLGTVTILSVLGTGMSASVYLGFQRTLRRQVAVKILAKTDTMHSRYAEQFRSEAEIVSNLAHPNIVPVHEIGESDDCFFHVMQVVKGESLLSLIAQRRNHPLPAHRLLPIERTIEICCGILDGLAYAHEEGIIHRDIKPANILIETRSGRPLIADFGIARTLRSVQTDGDTILGTPLYMAPECVAGSETDHRSDLYSVGVMLFEMLVGELPLADKETMLLLQRKMTHPETVFTRTPSEVLHTIDKALESIVIRALQPHASARYESAGIFREDLLAYGRMWAARSGAEKGIAV